jgi:AraC family transcriptional regulator
LWSGFHARICETSGGHAKPHPVATNCVVMHIGPAINTSCRCDSLFQRRRSTPGDLDIIPSACTAAWEEEGPRTILSISLMPSLVRVTAQGMGLDPDRVSLAPQLQLRDPEIEHIGWAIKAELEAAEPLGRLYAESLGTALAAALLRRYAPLAPHPLGRSLPKRRLQSVIDYIHDNLSHDLSLDELAAIAGLSTSHFKSLFKDATALPVHKYVIQCRVDQAVELLAQGKLSLSEVASLAGFADQSHMARCMRRVIGVTPALVRRRQR